MSAALARMDDVWMPPPQARSGLPVASALGGAMVVYAVNPMVPQLGLRRFGHCEGMTVREVIQAAGWIMEGNNVALRGGELVKPEALATDPIRKGELVVIIRLPQGGQGGASQIMAFVATLALAIFAPGLGAGLVGLMGGNASAVAFAGVTWGTLAQVGIVLAGSMIISALMPKPKPLTGQNGQAQNPSYSLSAQSNMARLLQPVIERFGRRKFLPELATQPSFRFDSGVQVLNEEFLLGMGEFEIEEIGVANTPIWTSAGGATGNYPDIEWQVLPPGVPNTLFSNNQVTSGLVSNIELIGTNQEGHGWSGPFILNPPGTLCDRIELDFSAPGGIFKIDDTGKLKAATAAWQAQVQEIDDTATPVGAWITVINKSISQATREAVRETHGAALAPARYHVRFQRTNAKSEETNTVDQIGILAMRGFLPNAAASPNKTRLAIRARSTKSLNGDAAQRFYVIATRKLPVPSIHPVTGAITWSAPVATRSIAWALAYVCKAHNGLRKRDDQVAIAKLIAYDAIWAARGDTFDGDFDDAGSAWLALQLIARCGRAEPRRIGRFIDFNRDEPKAIAKAPFSPANMLAGSFNVDYLMFDANSTDALWIDYVDERNWEPASVFCALPDSETDPNDAPHIPLPGVVKRDQAWREGIFMAATNRMRRTFPNFRTEMDGRPVFRGDRIAVAHWLTRWGCSGQVLDLIEAESGDLVLLSEPWDHQGYLNDDQPVVTLVTPDGLEWGPVPVEVVDDGAITARAQVRLMGTALVAKGKYAGLQPREWGVWAGEGLDMERPRAMWGTATQRQQDALVVFMRPETGNNVTLCAVIDDLRVHYADGTIPPVDPDDPVGVMPPETSPPVVQPADNLTITQLIVTEVPQQGSGYSAANMLSITIEGAPAAISFDAQWKWNDAADFSPISYDRKRTFQILALTGALTLQVRAVGGSGFGNWATKTFVAVSLPPAPGAEASPLIVTEVTPWVFGETDGLWSWVDNPDPNAIGYIIQYEWSDGGGWNPFDTSTALPLTEIGFNRVSQPVTGVVATAIRVGIKPVYPNGTAPNFIYPGG